MQSELQNGDEMIPTPWSTRSNSKNRFYSSISYLHLTHTTCWCHTM